MFAPIREAMVTALQAHDVSALDKLVQASNTNAHIAILGDLILALHALTDGGQRARR